MTKKPARKRKRKADPEKAEFRATLARLRAEKARLWSGNRHRIAGRKRRNDVFVNGSEAARAKALAARGEE